MGFRIRIVDVVLAGGRRGIRGHAAQVTGNMASESLSCLLMCVGLASCGEMMLCVGAGRVILGVPRCQLGHQGREWTAAMHILFTCRIDRREMPK